MWFEGGGPGTVYLWPWTGQTSVETRKISCTSRPGNIWLYFCKDNLIARLSQVSISCACCFCSIWMSCSVARIDKCKR